MQEVRLPGQDESGSVAEPDLLEACRRGDLSAFEDLYRTHGSRMKSLAWNILRNQTDAEDAVQEAFPRVPRDGDVCARPLSTWIYRIPVNACHDSRQRRRRRTRLNSSPKSIAGLAASPPTPAAPGAERAVAGLLPRQRDVFALRGRRLLHRDRRDPRHPWEPRRRCSARRELRSALGETRENAVSDEKDDELPPPPAACTEWRA